MTKVKFFADEKGLCGFEIKGHSSKNCDDELGKIVCAAVSSAAYMAANTVTEIIGDKAAADVSDGGSGARGVRRGESAVDCSVNFEEMRCFMESKTRMAGTDTAMGSRSTFRRT